MSPQVPPGVTVDSVYSNTEDECARATRTVNRLVTDEDDRREILQALGLEPPDFKWVLTRLDRGNKARRKLTLSGDPYPEEKTNAIVNTDITVPVPRAG